MALAVALDCRGHSPWWAFFVPVAAMLILIGRPKEQPKGQDGGMNTAALGFRNAVVIGLVCGVVAFVGASVTSDWGFWEMFAVAIGAEVVVGLPLVLLLKKLGRAGFPR